LVYRLAERFQEGKITIKFELLNYDSTFAMEG
jgi:hypothetical protein